MSSLIFVARSIAHRRTTLQTHAYTKNIIDDWGGVGMACMNSIGSENIIIYYFNELHERKDTTRCTAVDDERVNRC